MSFWFPEVINKIGILLKNTGIQQMGDRMMIFSMQCYGQMAAKAIRNKKQNAAIYHYRSGFGRKSVKLAKRKRMVTLCDHSIVHPALISYLTNNKGRLPTEGKAGRPNRFWSSILRDIVEADHILVNSDFVKKTFIHQGWSSNKIHTIYWGLDEQFYQLVKSTQISRNTHSEPIRLLFAGTFGKRKGAAFLISAINKIENRHWQLDIVGKIDTSIKKHYSDFFGQTSVHSKGLQSRQQLVKHMKIANVLVFPSFAEGSARVIFEAMACGCYVITTQNSGSIVEDGIHGAIVPPDDTEALKIAILWAINHRKKVDDIGSQNARFIRKHFRQSNYGNELVMLYDKLLKTRTTL
jgi:glycosyltransferase involved in cell wall biosynthesis